MSEDEERDRPGGSGATPFTPRSALVRTPPALGALRDNEGENMALTPTVPPRPPPPRPATTSFKRPLTSPEERGRPLDKVRLCRPSTPAPSRPSAPAAVAPEEEGGQDDQDEEAGAGDSLSGTKTELIERVHRDLGKVMAAVTAPPSKLNKEATNQIQRRVQDALAVVAALALRLSEREVELGEAHLRAARLEKELVEAKMAVTGGGGSWGPTGPSTVSYASSLKISKKAAPVPIPAAQGPVLAFYPAPEHAESFKSAEDTKAELKKTIRPQEIQLQVER
ncbi:jg1991, partial [Pararge aegeria aegeria]